MSEQSVAGAAWTLSSYTSPAVYNRVSNHSGDRGISTTGMSHHAILEALLGIVGC
jgi:hypothetical protein